MTDKKISELSAASALDGSEQVAVVQSGTTKRTTAPAIAGLAVVWSPPLDISTSDILTSGSQDIDLVPAPGAGLVNQVIGHWAVYTFNTKPFVGVASLETFIGYAGMTSDDYQVTLGDMLTKSASQFSSGLAAQETNIYYALSDCENKAITLASTEDPTAGAILTSSLGAGGSGYAPGDVGNVGPSYSAIYEVDTVDGGGAVLTYHLTDNGSGYVVGSHATVVDTGGGDGAFTINVDSASEGDGTLRVSVGYRTVAIS